MALLDLDPVISGFEQPFTRTPAGQLAIFQGPTAPTPPVGVGMGAGAGVVGPTYVNRPQVIGGAALPAMLAAPLAAFPGVVPAIAGIAGVAAAGIGIAQALGFGEGGGLFGLNILGGDEFTQGGLEFGGPGLPEPLAPYTEWRAGNKQFYHVPQYTSTGKSAGAKIAMYNRDTKRWKVWRLPKPHLAVIGKNMPRHQMIVRLRKNLMRHTADAKTILKLTSPGSLSKPQHRGHWASKKTWHK